MKKLILILSLFIAGTVTAAPVSPPVLPTITVGGRVFTDTKNLIILYGLSNGTNGNSTLRRANATSGYTPTGGKVFKAYAIKIYNLSSSASYGVSLSQSDNDLGIQSPSAMTNPVTMAGSTSMQPVTTATGLGQTAEGSLDFQIATGKFLTVTSSSSTNSGNIIVYGYEQ